MAAVEARRRRDPGPKDLALVERERVRVAPRGGAEIAPPRFQPLAPEPQPDAVVVTRPAAPARTRRRPWSDERKRRFQRRFLPTATALILAPVPIARVLIGGGSAPPVPLPPVDARPATRSRSSRRCRVGARGGSSTVMPEVVWRHSISLGLPYHGRLIDGVQLPGAEPVLDDLGSRRSTACPIAATGATAAPS